MQSFRLESLGPPRLVGPSGVMLGPARRRPLALLTYLARQAPRPVSREELAVLLWGERAESRARHSLRQLLFQLRGLLGPALHIGEGVVALHAAMVEFDVTAFESAVAAGRHVDADRLYGGEFMLGLDDVGTDTFRAWVDAERARLTRQLQWSLERWTDEAEARGDHAEACRAAERWSVWFPYDETALVRRVRALRRAGREVDALALHAAFVVRLREDLGEEPSPALVAEGVPAMSHAATAPHAVAPAEAVATPPLPAAELSPPRLDASAGRPRRRRVRSAGLAVLTLITSIMFALRSAPAPAAEDQPRVLVLPLQDRSADPRARSVGRIAGDWITQRVARSGLAHVAPLPPGSTLDPAAGSRARDMDLETASALHARLIVRGSFRVDADSIELRAEVVDVRSAQVLGVAGPVRTAVTQPMDGVEALSGRTLAALGALVDPRIAAAARAQGAPPSFASYQAFAEGLDEFYARRGELALPHFLRAYALDTTYTLPLLYAVLVHDGHRNLEAADSLLRRLAPRRRELPPYERHVFDYMQAMVAGDWRRMLAAAQDAAAVAPGSLLGVYQLPQAAIALNQPRRALALLSGIDPDRGAARGLPGYWTLLSTALHMSGEYSRQLGVGREVRRRLPDEVRAWGYEARALAALGRLRELDALLEESLLLPPVSWGAPGLFLHVGAAEELTAHGHSAHAQVVLERALRAYGGGPPALRRISAHEFELGRAFYHAGRLDEARRIFESQLSTGPAGPDLWGNLAFVAVHQGDSARVAEMERLLRSMDTPRLFGQNTEYLARIAAARGDREAAVRLLRQAVAEGRGYDGGKHLYRELLPLRGFRPFDEWLRPKG